MATQKPAKKHQQQAKPDCTPVHPNVPLLNAFESFLCGMADKANIPKEKDPTAPIQKNIEKALPDLAKLDPNQWKGIFIAIAILLIIILIKR